MSILTENAPVPVCVDAEVSLLTISHFTRICNIERLLSFRITLHPGLTTPLCYVCRIKIENIVLQCTSLLINKKIVVMYIKVGSCIDPFHLQTT
jgi:hypothetical protein